jgi:hypothetical protein
MKTVVVVVAEVGEYGSAGVVAGGPDGGADLGFEGGKERLRDGVVVARSSKD